MVPRITQEGLRPREAAQAQGVSPRTAYKWLKRFRAQGWDGLYERASRPARCPHQASRDQRRPIIALRRQRRGYRLISRAAGVSESTVSRVLQRAGLNRLAALDPAPPVRRSTHEAPGELLHLDIKKLGQFERPGHRVTGDRRLGQSAGAGGEYVHVAIDDHSRISHAQLHPDETAASAAQALIAALRYYRGLGRRVQARADRQRRLLSLGALCQTVPPAGPQA